MGDKGSGKTILAIELVIDLAKAVIDDPDGDGPAPVRLGAASCTPSPFFCILSPAILIEPGPYRLGLLGFVVQLYAHWHAAYAVAPGAGVAGSGHVIVRVSTVAHAHRLLAGGDLGP